jgi:hypothetical protein
MEIGRILMVISLCGKSTYELLIFPIRVCLHFFNFKLCFEIFFLSYSSLISLKTLAHAFAINIFYAQARRRNMTL